MPTSWMVKLPTFTLMVTVAAVLIASIGCDAQQRDLSSAAEPPASTVPTTRGESHQPATHDDAPMPDAARMRFDVERRELVVYPLPDRTARWMLSSPMSPKGMPIGLRYRFPAEVDLDLSQVAVFYIEKNRRPSAAVSLDQIVEVQTIGLKR